VKGEWGGGRGPGSERETLHPSGWGRPGTRQCSLTLAMAGHRKHPF